MLRSRLRFVGLVALGFLLTNCSDDTTLPTDAPSFKQGGVPAPQARINRLIKAVFPENPEKETAKNLFSEVKDHLSAGETEAGQARTRDLIDLVRNADAKSDHEDKALLINELLACAGISGAAGILGAAGGHLFSPDMQAAVSVPSGALLADHMISFNVKDQPCFPVSDIPLNQQFEHCYSFDPPMTFEKNVRVEICLLLPESHDDFLDAQLHSRGETGPPEPLVPAQHELVDCVIPEANAGTGFLARYARLGAGRLADLLLPDILAARTSLGPKGLGGLKGSFSDFGWALPQSPADPDLVVESVSIPGTTRDAPVTITVTVGNTGLGSAGPFDVEIQMEQGGDLVTMEAAVAGLGPKSSTAVPFNVPGCALSFTGFYSLRIEADVHHAVTEAEEGNNVRDNILFHVGNGPCP